MLIKKRNSKEFQRQNEEYTVKWKAKENGIFKVYVEWMKGSRYKIKLEKDIK